MDNKRIDVLARTLAGRRSRRGMLQVGVGGLGATLLGRTRRAFAATPGRYVAIRQYQLTGDISRVTPLLPALTGVMAKTAGVVTYSVVDAGNGRMFTVGAFVTKTAAEAAIPVETRWIHQHAAALLTASPPVGSGRVLASFTSGVDCPSAATPVSPTSSVATEPPVATTTPAATTAPGEATEAPPATVPAGPPTDVATAAGSTAPAAPPETPSAADDCCAQFCLGKPAGYDRQQCQDDCLTGKYEGVCTGAAPATPAGGS